MNAKRASQNEHRAGEPDPLDAPPGDDRKLELSIVVPCYNEELVLMELVRRVEAVGQATCGSSFELILVDDGSTDGTCRMIEEFAQIHHFVRGVVLSRNHGHQRALSAGLLYARGQRVLVIDADLQDPPELLPGMMARMDSGADVVFGQRRERAGEKLSKKVTAAAFYRVMRRLTDVDIPVDAGDFRLMRRIVVDHLNAMPEDDRFIRGMVSWLGFRQVPLSYDRSERYAGETKYPLRKMIRLAIDAITGFSIVPLRLATLLAALATAASIVTVGYVLVQKLLGNVVPGWSSVMIAVLVVSSVQLFAIGILGEYLGRLYMQSKQRPKYIVERLISGSAKRDT